MSTSRPLQKMAFEISNDGDLRDGQGRYYGKIQYLPNNRNYLHQAILKQWREWLETGAESHVTAPTARRGGRMPAPGSSDPPQDRRTVNDVKGAGVKDGL